MDMKTLDPVLHQIRKEAILQRARHMFATRGFAETSMDDIAHTSQMQKASLYHYFASKQQILQEIIAMEGERWSKQLEGPVASGTLREALLHLSLIFIKNFDDPARREFFQIIHFESTKNPAIFKAFRESPTYKRGAVYQVFAKHLEAKAPRVKIAIMVTQFMGSLIHYTTLSRLRGENMCLEKFSDEEFAEQLVDTFVRAADAL
jgi:AcrR family transcriptional regulator